VRIFSEEDLIAYHLDELAWWKKMLLPRQLKLDVELAAASEEIAATLRVFSGDPSPDVSEATLDRSWQRVRGSLSVLDAPRRSRRVWILGTASAGVAVALALGTAIAISRAPTLQGTGETPENSSALPRSWSQKLLAELQTHKPAAEPFNNRPGPLTTTPVDAVAEDPALATHLDTAERVLTEVSHTDGPLQPETREQVHRLLLENAVYRQSAEQHGDMEAAAVIDDLGRVLISLDAESLDVARRHHASNPDAFRLQMNLGGVLFDLRILHHNDGPNEGR
jgi:hypothetical protein